VSNGSTKGRAALITGGSRGIGLAIARVLGEEGFRMTICGRRPKRLAAAAGSLRADGFKVEEMAADVAKEEDVLALLARHREAHGRLDVLVNNAGAGVVQSIEATRTRLLDKLVAVNLRGLVLCTREALPVLREAGAEHGEALVVNVASIGGTEGRAGLPVYSATKAGAIAFTHSTAREVSGEGIQCTALAPGLVDTPMADYARDRLPGEEMIQPADVGEAVRFLLRTSPHCHVPEIVLTRPGGYPGGAARQVERG
jgi:NAD(P)-dependent dehydrogenase (short-subunit alcohol dehydrogenase family)